MPDEEETMPAFATIRCGSACLLLVWLALMPAFASDFPPIDRQWEDAFNRADAPALLALYTEDATVMPPHQPMATGPGAVRTVMQAHASAGLKVAIGPIETQGEGALAYQIGTWVVSNAEGKQLDHGKYMQVWKQVDGAWKIHRDMWNSDVVTP
jgi:ketosteroid isomerase-like protein